MGGTVTRGGVKISKILCTRRPQRALLWLLVKLVLAVAYQFCLNLPCIIPAITCEPLAGPWYVVYGNPPNHVHPHHPHLLFLLVDTQVKLERP